jgi:hypothetical protein
LIIKKLQRHIVTDGEGESVEEIMASEAEAKEELECKELAISHCLLSGQLGDAELLDTGCHLSSASLKKLFDITEKAQQKVQLERDNLKEKEKHLAAMQAKLDVALSDSNPDFLQVTQDKINAALKVQEESILGRYDEFEKQIEQER